MPEAFAHGGRGDDAHGIAALQRVATKRRQAVEEALEAAVKLQGVPAALRQREQRRQRRHEHAAVKYWSSASARSDAMRDLRT